MEKLLVPQKSNPKTQPTYIVKLNLKSIVSIIVGCVLGLLFGGGWVLEFLFEGTSSIFEIINYAEVKSDPKTQPPPKSYPKTQPTYIMNYNRDN